MSCSEPSIIVAPNERFPRITSVTVDASCGPPSNQLNNLFIRFNSPTYGGIEIDRYEYRVYVKTITGPNGWTEVVPWTTCFSAPHIGGGSSFSATRTTPTTVVENSGLRSEVEGGVSPVYLIHMRAHYFDVNTFFRGYSCQSNSYFVRGFVYSWANDRYDPASSTGYIPNLTVPGNIYRLDDSGNAVIYSEFFDTIKGWCKDLPIASAPCASTEWNKSLVKAKTNTSEVSVTVTLDSTNTGSLDKYIGRSVHVSPQQIETSPFRLVFKNNAAPNCWEYESNMTGGLRNPHKAAITSISVTTNTATITCGPDTNNTGQEQPTGWRYKLKSENEAAWPSSWTDATANPIVLNNLDSCRDYQTQVQYSYSVGTGTYYSAVTSITDFETKPEDADITPYLGPITDGDVCNPYISFDVTVPQECATFEDWAYTLDDGVTSVALPTPTAPSTFVRSFVLPFSDKMKCGSTNNRLSVIGKVVGENRTIKSNQQLFDIQKPNTPSVCVVYDPYSPTQTAEIKISSNDCDPYLYSYDLRQDYRVKGTNIWSTGSLAYETAAPDVNQETAVRYVYLRLEESVEYRFYAKAVYKNGTFVCDSIYSTPVANSTCNSIIAADEIFEYSLSGYDVRILGEYPVNYWNASLNRTVEPGNDPNNLAVVLSQYRMSLTDNQGKIFYTDQDVSDGLPLIYGGTKNLGPDNGKPEPARDVFRLTGANCGSELNLSQDRLRDAVDQTPC